MLQQSRETSTEHARGKRSSNRVLLQTFAVAAAAATLLGRSGGHLAAQAPMVVDPNLGVRTVVGNLQLPTAMAFLGANDLLVTEKATGRVLRVVNGSVQGAVLDLAVNSASERGPLGKALDPRFPSMPFVYLYWTESRRATIATCSPRPRCSGIVSIGSSGMERR